MLLLLWKGYGLQFQTGTTVIVVLSRCERQRVKRPFPPLFKLGKWICSRLALRPFGLFLLFLLLVVTFD